MKRASRDTIMHCSDWLVSKVEVQGSQVESSVSAADFILRSFGAASGLPCQLSVAIEVVVQVVDCSAVLLHPQVVQVWQEMLKHSRCITCSNVVMATRKKMLKHGRCITPSSVGMATMKEMLKRSRRITRSSVVMATIKEMLKHSRRITPSSVGMATTKEMLKHGRCITPSSVGMATIKEMLKHDRCRHLLKCGYGSN